MEIKTERAGGRGKGHGNYFSVIFSRKSREHAVDPARPLCYVEAGKLQVCQTVREHGLETHWTLRNRCGGSRASKLVVVMVRWLQGQQTYVVIGAVASGLAKLCRFRCGGPKASKSVVV